jgi:hypothetical protein
VEAVASVSTGGSAVTVGGMEGGAAVSIRRYAVGVRSVVAVACVSTGGYAVSARSVGVEHRQHTNARPREKPQICSCQMH